MIGIITSVNAAKKTFSKKTKQPISYVDVMISDSSCLISCRFWKNVDDLKTNMIGKSILCYGAVVNKYNGRISLNQWSHFTFLDDYDGENKQIHKILAWNTKQESNESLQETVSKLKCLSLQNVDWASIPKTTLSEVKEKLLDLKKNEQKITKSINVKFNGSLKFFYNLDRTSKETYAAKKGCFKKLKFEGNKYHDREGNTFSEEDVHQVFQFNVVFEDDDQNLKICFFNKAGQQLFQKTADEIHKLKFKSNSQEGFKFLIDELKGCEYEICCTVSCSERSRNGETQIYYNLIADQIKLLEDDTEDDESSSEDDEQDFEVHASEKKW